MPQPLHSSSRTVPGRAVVTGVAGFIGSHLAEALVNAGGTVLGIDRRDPERDPVAVANLRAPRSHPRFTYLRADLRTDSVASALTGSEVLFHLAGMPGVPSSWGVAFEEYVNSNILATHRLIEDAVRSRVRRVVLSSSSSVYGPNEGTPSRESDTPRPISPYGVSKLAAEHLCLAHARRADSVTSVVVLRHFTVYGPRQRDDMFIQRVLVAALGDEHVRLFGDGAQRRDFTYAGDVVDALIAAATAPAGTGIVNIGAGTCVSLRKVIGLVEELTGRPVRLRYARARNGDVQATWADPAKSRAVLGWRPAVTLAEGVARQFHWLRQCAESPEAHRPPEIVDAAAPAPDH